jgi:diaminohydroxyphosphoribosylaminopyrimidine deaminase/5-amino-6-(5-phosphoribosylamino)uracil reductase
MAMSLDGRTALANGESQWISTEQSRRDVHRLRASSSAILTSAESVIHDDPSLNARELDFYFKQEVRVIVDRQLKTPTKAKIFTIPGKIIIYTQNDNKDRIKEFENMDAEVVVLRSSPIWLKNVFSHLAKEKEINELMVEAGSNLNGALIEQGLIDEMIVYMAPLLLGHDANPLLKLKKIESLSLAKDIEIKDVRQVGKDLRFTLAL